IEQLDRLERRCREVVRPCVAGNAEELERRRQIRAGELPRVLDVRCDPRLGGSAIRLGNLSSSAVELRRKNRSRRERVHRTASRCRSKHAISPNALPLREWARADTAVELASGEMTISDARYSTRRCPLLQRLCSFCDLLAQPRVRGARREARIPRELLAQRRHVERQLEQAKIRGLLHPFAETLRHDRQQPRAS